MNLTKTLSIAALLALLVLSFARAPAVLAAGIVVTTTADDTTNGNGCSLREAITNANNNAATYPDCAAGDPGADFITFNIPASDTGCVVPNTCTITLTSIFVAVTDSISIDGAPQKITVDGVNSYGIFTNNTAGVSMSIHHMTMYRGSGGFDGGGGVYNGAGTTFVDSSTFIDNSGLSGGAVHNIEGTVTIVNSTIVGSASISQVASGTLGVGGTLNIYNTTIDGLNTPLRSGVNVASGSGTLYNTIVANHTTGDCLLGMAATFTTNAFSFDTDGTCTGATTSATLNLGAVQDNGGPTPTIALGLGSSAIDAGLDATCTAFPVNSQDQRGILRPQGTFCDPGAFEVDTAQAGPNFVVTQTADTDSGVCGVVYCTLREAIDTANAVIGANTITFAIPATEACSMPNVCTITLSDELPAILDTLTIDGSAQVIIVDGAGIVRIVVVDSIGTEVHIQDMTLTNGLCDSCDGGAILNQPNSFLTLERVRLTGNHAAQGGAIANDQGSVSIIDSTLNDNHADIEDGGGVWNDSGFVSVLRTTVSNNTAEDDGGGLNNRGMGATMYVFNSTLSGNSTPDLGGGFRNVSGGIAGLFNVTITNNNANGGGGGIAQEDLSLTIINSIVAGNTVNNDINDTTADCFYNSGFTSDGYNLFGEDTGCPTIFSDLTVTPANIFTTVLLNLAANGGPTLTHALRTNSPAVNAGRPTIDGGCVELNDIPLTDDQRGEPRPVGTACDIGAFELGAPTSLNVSKLKGKLNNKGVVILKWRSLNESELSGFTVYRRTGKGEWAPISDFLGAKFPGSALGNPYRFKDKETKAGKHYRYRVQVVFADTHTEWTNIVKLKSSAR